MIDIHQTIKAGAESICPTCNHYPVCRAVDNQPCAECNQYSPAVHSRWAHIGGDEWCCPVCGFVITTEGSWDKPTKKILRGLRDKDGRFGMKLFQEWRKKRKLRKICKANHFNCLECIHHEDVFSRTSRLGVRCRLDDEDRIYLIMEEQ